MAMFSINQVRQLYVAKAVKTDTPEEYGDIKLVTKPTSNPLYGYFQYASQGDSLLRSDIFDFDKVIKVKAVDASTLNTPKTKITVTVTQAVAGQSYSVMLNFRNYIGIGDEDTTTREGIFTPTSSTATVQDIVNGLSYSLNLNLGNTYKEYDSTTKLPSDYGTDNVIVGQENLAKVYVDGTNLVIEQVEQKWTRGKMQVAYMPIECHLGKIAVDGVFDDFGTVTEEQDGTFKDAGKKLADLEYFTLGARGDIYRGMGYPNNFDAEYLVDASSVGDGSSASILEIHYSYIGSNEGAQKSEKDIEVIFTDSADTAKTVATTLASYVPAGVVSSVDSTGTETILTA